MMGVQNFALIVFAFLIILLLPGLPLWLVVAATILGLWKWWILRSGSGQPSRVLLSALGTLLMAFVFLDSAPIFSRESMMSIVCIACMLFILDRPHLRQVMLVHGAFYGMLISLLVMRAAPLPLFLYFFMTVLIFFSLLLHHLPPSALFSLWPLGRNILKISLPVAAILLPVYFFFPEIRPKTSEFAVSGMSDILEPGRIANLALSDRVAFRVRFLQEKPEDLPLYWRGTVMEESFGMTWRKKRKIEMLDYTPRPTTGPLTYEIIPEVRLGLGLPLLEHTLAVQGVGNQATQIWWHPDLRIYQTQNELIEASAAPMDRFFVSHPPAQEDLKIQISARTRALVQELKPKTPEQQVQFLLERMSDYTYTLKPGTLNREDALDDFLFVKKRGFCEHFAASFASLLQLAGTPARVVTGYEGGVFIGNSDFLLVRDSDAHAWVEVYWDGRWRRVDPTLVARSEVSREDRVWLTALPSAWFAYGLRIVVVKLREWTQEFEYLWMGLIAVLAVIVPIQIYRMQQKRLNRPIWQSDLEAFLRDLEKRGIKRESHEGMRDFLSRVAQTYPQNATSLDELSQLYQDVLYGPNLGPRGSEDLLKRFRQLRRLIKKAPRAAPERPAISSPSGTSRE